MFVAVLHLSLSYVCPVLRLSCPTFVLSYVCPVLRLSCHTLVSVLLLSCPTFVWSYVCPVLRLSVRRLSGPMFVLVPPSKLNMNCCSKIWLVTNCHCWKQSILNYIFISGQITSGNPGGWEFWFLWGFGRDKSRRNRGTYLVLYGGTFWSTFLSFPTNPTTSSNLFS